MARKYAAAHSVRRPSDSGSEGSPVGGGTGAPWRAALQRVRSARDVRDTADDTRSIADEEAPPAARDQTKSMLHRVGSKYTIADGEQATVLPNYAAKTVRGTGGGTTHTPWHHTRVHLSHLPGCPRRPLAVLAP